jgi:hypothetical protein
MQYIFSVLLTNGSTQEVGVNANNLLCAVGRALNFPDVVKTLRARRVCGRDHVVKVTRKQFFEA